MLVTTDVFTAEVDKEWKTVGCGTATGIHSDVDEDSLLPSARLWMCRQKLMCWKLHPQSGILMVFGAADIVTLSRKCFSCKEDVRDLTQGHQPYFTAVYQHLCLNLEWLGDRESRKNNRKNMGNEHTLWIPFIPLKPGGTRLSSQPSSLSHSILESKTEMLKPTARGSMYQEISYHRGVGTGGPGTAPQRPEKNKTVCGQCTLPSLKVMAVMINPSAKAAGIDIVQLALSPNPISSKCL
ncbi:PREDICTED: uncharacterized protein LOC106149180 [Chinchilla lanigera]|uniref:uncharacterized protein LOC106149180 n=1 Tax=Chinchilla lanigera TaxID=34839 RepID=UPI00069650F7|nr:PREDICTED: uncharacterized protein LOC106149180 [Chinchilla lanigera]